VWPRALAPLVRVLFAWECEVGDSTPLLPSPTFLSAAVVVAALLPMMMDRECRRNLPWEPAFSSRMTADSVGAFGKGW
jgi:hypothetical protein